MHFRRYCFDRYTIDPARHEFCDGNERVSLPLKVFEVIAYLLKHRDRAVCRDELISAVWGRIDVSDNTLNQIVYRARQAVGDCNNQQRIIRTVPHFGYYWVQPVEETAVELTLNGQGDANGHTAETDAVHSDTEPAAKPLTRVNGHAQAGGDVAAIHAHLPESRPETAASEVIFGQSSTGMPPCWRKSVRWLAPTLAVAVVIMTIAFWPENDKLEESALAPAVDQIALVLPVSVVGDENEAWIRLGVMDLIAERLRKAGQAVVPSDNTIALAQGFESDVAPESEAIRQLALTAAVQIVMHPRAERIDGHWRVTLQAIHGFESPMVANGESEDIIAAARAATDRISLMLGYPMLADNASGEPTLDRVLQQVRAAMLSDRFDEARALLDSAYPAYRSHPRLRLQSAAIDLQAGHLVKAEAAYHALLRDVPTAVDPLIHARALRGLGDTLLRNLDYTAADAVYTEAAQLLDALDGYEARNTLGEVLLKRFGIRSAHRNYRAAGADYARARVALESTGDWLALARLDGNLALFLGDQGRFAEAVPHARRALERIRSLGDLQSEIRLRTILAWSHSALLDAPAALAEVERIKEVIVRLDNKNLDEAVNSLRIDILFSNGHLQVARELLERKLGGLMLPNNDRAIWTNPPDAIAAHQSLARDDPEAAIRYAEAALMRIWDRTVAGTRSKARLWLTLLRARLRTGQMETETVAAFRAWAETEHYPEIELYTALFEAEYAAAFDEPENARTYFETALEQAETNGVPIRLLEVAEPYVTWLIVNGDLDHASVVAGSVARWADTNYNAALLQLRLYHALGDPAAWRLALNRASSLAGEREVQAELLADPQSGPVSVELRDAWSDTVYAVADNPRRPPRRKQ